MEAIEQAVVAGHLQSHRPDQAGDSKQVVPGACRCQGDAEPQESPGPFEGRTKLTDHAPPFDPKLHTTSDPLDHDSIYMLSWSRKGG